MSASCTLGSTWRGRQGPLRPNRALTTSRHCALRISSWALADVIPSDNPGGPIISHAHAQTGTTPGLRPGARTHCSFRLSWHTAPSRVRGPIVPGDPAGWKGEREKGGGEKNTESSARRAYVLALTTIGAGALIVFYGSCSRAPMHSRSIPRRTVPCCALANLGTAAESSLFPRLAIIRRTYSLFFFRVYDSSLLEHLLPPKKQLLIAE